MMGLHTHEGPSTIGVLGPSIASDLYSGDVPLRSSLSRRAISPGLPGNSFV